ncbi:hypothetical protein K7X08_023446 [Anisodus acutangulus]|uniref:Uncharacterized protein n=1 Tax=Anisodus acutangulus TaxID=402998 RepID=A0A9Q1R138_9SOLA|nr:hypothetical protein K7X08_023446 [Anisodus acutangulus]
MSVNSTNRDLVLGHGALVPLLAQFNEHAKLSMLRNATCTLSNFCRGKPQPQFEKVVIEAGVCPRLVELLLHSSPFVLIPALRTVGNIVTGDDIQTHVWLSDQSVVLNWRSVLFNPG